MYGVCMYVWSMHVCMEYACMYGVCMYVWSMHVCMEYACMYGVCSNPVYMGAQLAQWLEHQTFNLRVAGSNPVLGVQRGFFCGRNPFCWRL